MVVQPEREFLDRHDRAAEGEDGAVAVMREGSALDVRERAAGGKELLFEVVTDLDRDFRLAENGQAGGIRLRRRGVVGQPEERTAHPQRTSAGIAEVELQSRERLDVDVLRHHRDRDQRHDHHQCQSAHHSSESG